MWTWKQINKNRHITLEKYTAMLVSLTFKVHHYKRKFSGTAAQPASFTAWLIFFSSLFKNDTDQFLFGNFANLPRSIALLLSQNLN